MTISAVTQPTFAGIPSAIVQSTSAAAKLELIAYLTSISNLLGTVNGPDATAAGGGATPTSPDFDTISPTVGQQLKYEIQQLQYAIQSGA